MTQTVQEFSFDDDLVPEQPPRSPGWLGLPKRQRAPGLVSPELAAKLVAEAGEAGIDVAGRLRPDRADDEGGLEAALAEQLTDHLGYEPGDPGGRGSGNSRAGSTSKTLLTEAGPVELETPRDRAGNFEPEIVRNGHRHLDGIDAIVLGRYAKGMSTRDITAHVKEIHGVEISLDLVSNITDQSGNNQTIVECVRVRVASGPDQSLTQALGHRYLHVSHRGRLIGQPFGER